MVCKINPRINRVWVVGRSNGRKQIASSEWIVLRTKQALSQFLKYQFSEDNFRQRICTDVTGVGGSLTRAQPKNVAKFSVVIAPLPEQKLIAYKLDCLLAKVDTCKARLDKVPEIINRFRQSVLADATSGRLTEDWRTEDSHLNEAQGLLEIIKKKRDSWINEEVLNGNSEAKRLSTKLKKHLPKYPSDNLPNSWKWATLLESSWLVVDCRNKTAPYTDVGIPLVRTTNIRDGKLVLDKMKYVNEETYKFWSRRCSPEQGDIFFTREAPMGEAMIVPEGQKLCMGQRTMLLRSFHDLLDNRFLLYCLLDPNFKSRMMDNAIGTGVKHLRVGDVENLCVPFTPIEEQKEIVK
ncbi:MAG: restriction endonuclease subunit S [SAR324 cluster bacterium]|nr:restriction endonuclease subunit S [SAR324 cluster bacterium]